MSLLKSIWKYIKSGCRKSKEMDYQNRLDICNTCDKRNGLICTECYCVIAIKASWESEKCPINKW